MHPQRRLRFAHIFTLLCSMSSVVTAHDIADQGESSPRHSHRGGSNSPVARVRVGSFADLVANRATVAVGLVFEDHGLGDGKEGPKPDVAQSFDAFSKQVKLRWDDRFLYVESNGMPN